MFDNAHQSKHISIILNFPLNVKRVWKINAKKHNMVRVHHRDMPRCRILFLPVQLHRLCIFLSGTVALYIPRFQKKSYSPASAHTPLLKHFRGDIYETGNQKDCDKKCVILWDPHRQRSGNEARIMAQCAECTGCRHCIGSAVPSHCPRCRTRGINLN